MNIYYMGSALNLSALYMLAGSGALISIKSGDFNLGGEGQIYLGGFVCAVLLAKFGVTATLIAVLMAAAASSLMAGLSALFKIFRQADFLFTSFILSAAIIPLIDGLIAGPFRSPTDNLLATPYIAEGARLPGILPPSPLNASFIAALALCAAAALLLYRTPWGRQLRTLGVSPEFSRYAGFACRRLSLTSALISGALHGLAGAAAILGTYYTCHQGFYSGMGWNAFSSALIAGANPLLLIPSSILMGFITTYSNKYAMYHNFGFDMSGLIQAGILFLISFKPRSKVVSIHQLRWHSTTGLRFWRSR